MQRSGRSDLKHRTDKQGRLLLEMLSGYHFFNTSGRLPVAGKIEQWTLTSTSVFLVRSFVCSAVLLLNYWFKFVVATHKKDRCNNKLNNNPRPERLHMQKENGKKHNGKSRFQVLFLALRFAVEECRQ